VTRGGRRLAVATLGAALLAVLFHLGREAWIARKLANLDGLYAGNNKCFGVEPASETAQRRIYLIGDSTVSSWRLVGFDPRYEPVDCGMTGETTAQLVQRFDRFDFLHPDDVVVLTTGLYDAVGASFSAPERLPDLAEKAADRVFQLALLARGQGVRVLVTTVLPPFDPEVLRLPFWHESLRDFTEQANASLRAKFSKDGAGELVDLARLLGGDDRRSPAIWRRNGLRLNARGYQALTDEINRRLAKPLAGQ
jgi:hypothetical protein